MATAGPDDRSAVRKVAARAPEPLKRPARRALGWVDRRRHRASPGPIAAREVFPVQPPTQVPPGHTEESVRAMLASLAIGDAPAEELKGYLDDCFLRVLHTWKLVAPFGGRALELGANPYFITTVLQEHTELELELANYFGPSHPEPTFTQPVTHTRPNGEVVLRELTSSHFNLEEERFPWPDATFDVVLFCEIIEHLLMDPVRVLREIRRVLSPGGRLVLTTPNVDRLDNVLRLVAGANVYDPYSGYGPYGRHNREYNRHELHTLLAYLGFEVEESFTADAHPTVVADRRQLYAVEPLLRFREEDLGQYVFVRARAAAPGGTRKPSFLYRSYPAGELEPVD